jgi:flagellar biosynthesis regulator FlbT
VLQYFKVKITSIDEHSGDKARFEATRNNASLLTVVQDKDILSGNYPV